MLEVVEVEDVEVWEAEAEWEAIFPAPAPVGTVCAPIAAPLFPIRQERHAIPSTVRNAGPR